MRVRKIAKQLKCFYESYKGWDKENEMGIYSYHLACFDDKVRYMIRMSRKHYFGLTKKYPPNSIMAYFNKSKVKVKTTINKGIFAVLFM